MSKARKAVRTSEHTTRTKLRAETARGGHHDAAVVLHLTEYLDVRAAVEGMSKEQKKRWQGQVEGRGPSAEGRRRTGHRA